MASTLNTIMILIDDYKHIMIIIDDYKYIMIINEPSKVTLQMAASLYHCQLLAYYVYNTGHWSNMAAGWYEPIERAKPVFLTIL